MGFGAQFVLPQQTILDSNGDPVSGAKVYFYDVGTTDEQTVYTDSALSVAHAQPVVADGAGRLAPVFIAEGTYKIVVKDGADNTIYSEDNLKAPKDGALVSLTFARPQTPVETITSTATLSYPNDFGKLKEADSTGGSFTVTLPDAATAGNGAWVEFLKRGTSGTVTVKSSGTDKITDASGNETATYQLAETGASVTLRSTGAGWTAIGRLTGAGTIEDGAITIAKLGTSVTGRLAQTGDCRFFPYEKTPDPGWARCDGAAISRTTYADLFALIGTMYGDGDGSTTFNLPDWRGAFFRMWDDGAGIDPDAAGRDESTNPGGTAGADEVSGDNVGTRQDGSIESHLHAKGSLTVSIGGAGGHSHTIPIGGNQVLTDNTGGTAAAGVNNSNTGSEAAHTHTASVNGSTASTGTQETRPVNVAIDVHILIAEDETSGASSSFQTLLHGAGSPNDDLGNNDDFYLDTASLEVYGPKVSDSWIGTNTPIVGHAGINHRIDLSATVGAGIGNGDIRADNATWTSATTLYIADLDRFGNDRSDFLAAINNGRIIICNSGDPNERLSYDVTGAGTDQSTYYEFTVALSSGDYAPADDDLVFALEQLPGTTGAAGATGTVSAAGDGTEAAPGIAWSSDSDTGFRRTASGETRYVADGADAVEMNGDGVELIGTDTFFLLTEHTSAPSTPATGKVAFYTKSDGKAYIKDDAGTETDLTATGGGGGVPSGTVIYSAQTSATPPSGYLVADGSAVSRTTYATLFSAIGVRYGVGDGSTTFNLPDLRGRFIRVWDNGAGIDPDAASRTDSGDGTTGDNVGTLQADEFKSHTHDFDQYDTSAIRNNGASSTPISSTVTSTTAATGGNETRPVNIALQGFVAY